MRKKSHLSWFILAVFMMTIAFGGVMPNVANAANLTDVQGHWAAAQINAMVDQGIVAGYPNNTFKPNANITRAEFIVLSNKSFAFDNTAEINYSDVKSSDWFANDIAKAKAAGYISGYENGTMKPNNNISRQEAAVIVANILKLNSAGSDELKKFKDASSIPAWSASSVAALVKGGILAGYPDGTFQPKKAITRAEAVVILTKAKGTTTPSKPEPGIDLSKISKAGTYGPATGNQAISGDVTISASGVTLQNATVSGDLTITDAVGNGDVTLKNVTVKGTAYIKGGGANSIHLNNCVFGKVVINKAGGNLRVALEGSTSISNLVADSGVNVVGKGTITKATINAANVTIEIKPGTTTVANNISATVAGETVKGSTSSSGGGGGGGGGTTTPTKLTIQASPPSGAVAAGTPVYLSSLVGAEIYYTTDGSEPKTSSTKYTGAITVNSAMTIRAIAVKNGYTTSAPCTFNYTIKQPIISLIDVQKSEVKALMPGVNQLRVFLLTGTTDDYTITSPGLTFTARSGKDGWIADIGSATSKTVTVTRKSDQASDTKTIGGGGQVPDPTPGTLINTTKSEVKALMPGVNQLRVLLLSGTTDEYTITGDGLTFTARTAKDGWIADIGSATSKTVTVTRKSDNVYDTKTIGGGSGTPTPDPTPGTLINTTTSEVKTLMPGVNQLRVLLLSGTTDEYTITGDGLTFSARSAKDGWVANIGAATKGTVTVTRKSDNTFDTKTIGS